MKLLVIVLVVGVLFLAVPSRASACCVVFGTVAKTERQVAVFGFYKMTVRLDTGTTTFFVSAYPYTVGARTGAIVCPCHEGNQWQLFWGNRSKGTTP